MNLKQQVGLILKQKVTNIKKILCQCRVNYFKTKSGTCKKKMFDTPVLNFLKQQIHLLLFSVSPGCVVCLEQKIKDTGNYESLLLCVRPTMEMGVYMYAYDREFLHVSWRQTSRPVSSG